MTTLHEQMADQLSQRFDPSTEKILKKGGASLTYIPVSEVITRLNSVLGIDGWGYKIVYCERDSINSDFVVAHVRLSVYMDDRVIERDGVGGVKIKFTKNGDPVDLGDEFKGAVSDALKKAAQSLGVAIYLARSEEALYLEEVNTVPVSAEYFEKLRDILNDQTVSVREKAQGYWLEISGGKLFENENVTRPLLDDMLKFVKEQGAHNDQSG